MPLRQEKKLNAAFVRTVKKPGKYGDGQGLALVVKATGAKHWTQRLMINGRRVDLGHGSASLVSLAEARDAAWSARKQARAGGDPLAERQKSREVIRFEDVARTVFEIKRPTWKNEKHAAQWISTMETYVFPSLGQRKVSEISIADVLQVLTPIWTSKHETASRVKQRISDVFKWAIAQGWRMDNPALVVGDVLPKIGKSQVKPRVSLDYERIGEFVSALQQSKSSPLTKLAFEFLILTAGRSGEIRGAEWSEIDLDKEEWTIPAGRMKANAEHRVPLTPRMVAILREAHSLSGNRILVFPGPRGDKMLSDATFMKVAKELGHSIHVHGFRSTFRTWAQDHTDYAREVVEAALAHQEKDKVVAAYARSDLFGKRRLLMIDWESWVRDN